MKVLVKLFRALRGGVNEVGETIVDSQKIRILKEEMRMSKTELETAKKALAGVMASHHVNDAKLKTLNDEKTGFEEKAVAAAEAGIDDLAEKTMARVLEITAEIAEYTSIGITLNSRIEETGTRIKDREKLLKRNEMQIGVIESNELLNKTSATMEKGLSNTGSTLVDVQKTMKEIKEKQAHDAAKYAAYEKIKGESDGSSLEAELKKAGIGDNQPSAKDALAALIAKKAS
jgi:phage shock protein A